MKPASASCGLTFHCAEDLTAKLRVMTLAGYDFLATPIVHPRYRLPEILDQSLESLSGKKLKYYSLQCLAIGNILNLIYTFFCGLFLLIFFFLWICLFSHRRRFGGTKNNTQKLCIYQV